MLQAGGLASLAPEGYKEMMKLVNFYKENADILRKCFQEMGFTVRHVATPVVCADPQPCCDCKIHGSLVGNLKACVALHVPLQFASQR